MSPEGLTLFQSSRHAGWQNVFHFHMHVVPRWEGDGLEPSWGEPSGNRDDIEVAAFAIRNSLLSLPADTTHPAIPRITPHG
jgi:histidine triad (HIT) family protein